MRCRAKQGPHHTMLCCPYLLRTLDFTRFPARGLRLYPKCKGKVWWWRKGGVKPRMTTVDFLIAMWKIQESRVKFKRLT